MDLLVFLPLVLALVALARVLQLHGWEALVMGRYRPAIPPGAPVLLVGWLAAQLLGGILVSFGGAVGTLGRWLLSPGVGSLVVSAAIAMVMVRNWRRKA